MPFLRQPTATGWNILFLAWLLAFASTLGSLFFSDVMNFAPCILCWYQRIFLFPLVFIFTTGLIVYDRSVVRYALPLTVAGLLVAIYQNLMIFGIVPDSIQPCSQGVSCTEKYIELFGFLSIPLLSLLAFTTILVLLLILNRRFKR